ncbi:hypothetical protein [Butyrivibrio sp. XPD2006]|uniref:hypothetical protein n=1 Tax=Butyrivibrio sp. XPD2006 TaxID=1280668 RepID=UPI0003B5ABAF|nr:hypothetical protein [Butyrivibrio sp. XPD2006]
MKIEELKAKLEREGLLPMYYCGCPKHFIPGVDIFSNEKWGNMPDVFGVYKSADTNLYIFFITDSERGRCCHKEWFYTEEEACEYVLKRAQISKDTFLEERNTFVNDVVPQRFRSTESEKYTYYKFDIGNGAMRKKGCVVEYIDKNGNWVENIELLRNFIGLDTGFYEITEAEAEAIVQSRKNKEGI